MTSSVNDGRPATWKEKRRGRPPNYKYKTLEDIYDDQTSSSIICNIYGIVTDFKEPTKSKGSDHYALVFVMDDTNQNPIRVRLFYGDPAFFPIVGVGDIIRLHRLKVSKRLDEVTLISTKGWSWVLWDVADPFKEEKSSSHSYTLLKSDRDRVIKLREWQTQYSDDYTGDNNNFKRISEINIGEHVCVLCKVIAFEKPSNSKIIAKICDGTKPKINFHRFEPTTYVHKATDIPFEYVIDVAIFSNHVDKWNEIGVMEGSYIALRGLHAWPNPSNELNTVENVCCELSLHSGTVRGRAVEKAPDDDLLYAVKLDISAVRREAMGDMDEIELFDDSRFTQSDVGQLEREDPQSSMNTPQDDTPQPSTSRKRSYSASASNSSQLPPNTKEHDTPENGTGTPRSSQESWTVITGEGMPMKLSSIEDIKKHRVGVNESKLFLARVILKSCETPEEEYAGHYSPVTTIFYPTLNEGEPLCMSDDAMAFIEAWRKVRGLDQLYNSTTVTDSQPFSQWEIPSLDGETHSLNIEKYKCTKDGSDWESMKTSDHIVRKRKSGKDRFTILYILQDFECTLEGLKKYASKYDRVIRVSPLASLTSQTPPAVGIQDGVFYYCCPANAVQPQIPSLQDEAEKFIQERISTVAGSPALVPFYNIQVTLSDDSGILENVHLLGKNAAHFFCDTSPQDFLTDKDEVTQEVKDCIDIFTRNGSVFECIIEKKSRLNVKTREPFYIYSIRNTALRLSEESNLRV